MTKQPNALQAVLDRAAIEKVQPSVESSPKPVVSGKSGSKEGRVLVGGHFPKSVAAQLRIIAAEEGTTNRALLIEALDMLFLKKGKRKIADL